MRNPVGNQVRNVVHIQWEKSIEKSSKNPVTNMVTNPVRNPVRNKVKEGRVRFRYLHSADAVQADKQQIEKSSENVLPLAT